jgi:hypothetical protein
MNQSRMRAISFFVAVYRIIVNRYSLTTHKQTNNGYTNQRITANANKNLLFTQR